MDKNSAADAIPVPKCNPFLKAAVFGRTTRPIRTRAKRVSPNARCPCGSGKKWKRCHGQTPAPVVLPETPQESAAPAASPESLPETAD